LTLKGKGAVEELLGDHGKELSLVRCAVGIDEGFVAPLGEEAQPLVFAGTDFHPFSKLVAVSEGWGSVGNSIEHIELVGKFVINHVMTLLGMACATEDCVPNKDHRTFKKSLAQNGYWGRYHTAHTLENSGIALRRHDGGRIDKDRLYVAIVVVGTIQLQQTRLGSDCDADFVGEIKTAAPLPVLLLK